MLFPSERSLRQIEYSKVDKTLLIAIKDTGSKNVYGGLLWYSQLRGWKQGWAAFVFKEIFGVWPRPQDKTEPICIIGSDLEEWVMRRKRSAKDKRPRKS
jgi:hypothetical protein